MKRAVELTEPLAFLLLHELRTPSTGTELAKRIGDRRGALLTPGTIYPALKTLHRKHLITYRSSGREKRYKLSMRGEQELSELYKEFSRLFRGLRHKIRSVRTRAGSQNA